MHDIWNPWHGCRKCSEHDIWNPWHGCRKCSEGCENCYMYFLDGLRDKDGSEIYRTKAGFRYPLSKDRNGRYKVQSGEMIRVCMTSDFFLEEADAWRDEAWSIMRQRPDVKFFLLTKRPQRVAQCLPMDWGDGWENVMFNVTFVFCGTGRRFVKDGKLYQIEKSSIQSQQAFRSGLSFKGKPMEFKLHDGWGYPIPEEQLYVPYFGQHCRECGMRISCNGCSRCGKCGETG